MTASVNPFEQVSLDQLRQRTSMKWRAHPGDVLPLWVAEMDALPAEPVVTALHDALARGDTGYPAGRGYAEALAEFASRRWGWDGLDVARTAVVPDVMLGIVEALRLVTAPGDAVVVNCPVYPPFYSFVEHMDRRIEEAPLDLQGRLDLDALQDAFARATLGGGGAAYLLCSPHNPTGTVHTRAELAAVAELAGRYAVRVVVDEIHGPLVLQGASFVPYLSVEGSERAFTLTSASKGWNLAGLKAALLLAGPEAAEDLARLPEEVGHGPSHLAVIAHTAALRAGEPWLEEVLRALDGNRALLADLTAQHLPGVRFRPPQGTYLAWLDCRDVEIGEQESRGQGRGDAGALAGPAAMWLQEARVALSSGHAFGTGGAGHVRLNFATSPAILTEAVQRMGAALHRVAG
ncbi:MAG: MalY/PatB family protein [Ornithinimicrobium sp.]|jgi:cystathionine beta-lyase|uniref:MalY/PatB family protein n=1 Tax=Ornithinimicrobium sp. TaxID=1977084 RepID=UPI003D9B6FE8